MVQPVAPAGVTSAQFSAPQVRAPEALATAAVVPAPADRQVCAEVALPGLFVLLLPEASAGSTTPTLPASSPSDVYQIRLPSTATMYAAPLTGRLYVVMRLAPGSSRPSSPVPTSAHQMLPLASAARPRGSDLAERPQ
jgi:hypothetical protein